MHRGRFQGETSDFFDVGQRPRGAKLKIGTAGWTDPTLTKCGRFYPRGTSSAEARLRFYAGCFNLVEVDSTYYRLPAEQQSRLWVERTPRDFTFNIKAFSAMTQHPTRLEALPHDLRSELPRGLADNLMVSAKELPGEFVEAIWSRFTIAVKPLLEAGRLGAVLLQFPKWFPCSTANKDYILESRDRLKGMRVAVEFRQSTWMSGRNRAQTVHFLRKHDLINVCVDEPQGLPNSVPMVAEVTSRIAMLRLHGRNSAAWNKPGAGVQERFRYLYSGEELRSFVPIVRDFAASAAETHVVFNNCHQDFAVQNARDLIGMLT
jgi:uncharacterized protein YecE (DUF72 family)